MSTFHVVFVFIFTVFVLASSKESTKTDQSVDFKKFEDGGRFLFLFDNLFTDEVLKAYVSLVSFGNIEGMVSPWQYSYQDYYFKVQLVNSSTHVPWISPVDLNFFVKTNLWRKIKDAVHRVSGREYFPYDVFVSMVRRLDFTTVDSARAEDDDDLTARILLAPRLKKNDYGESVYYMHNGEILAAVFPKFGRLLIWNASVPYTYKPPAMSYLQGLYSITIRLSTSHDKMNQGALKTKEQISSIHKYDKMDFPLTDDNPLSDKNPKDCLTKKIHDKYGRVVAYFDGLLSKGDLDALRLFLLHYNTAYAYQAYDESSDTEHDNVSWIVGIRVAKFVKSRLWKEVNRAIEFLSGKKGWYPYDVSMNVIRHSHYTRIHEDCENHENEYTILMYLTPEWKAEYFGETAFFEERMQPNGKPYPKGHRQYDWLTSVRPRYGRLVIFRGIIPHSARPPSAGFTGARYTFACKVSRTSRIAHAKMLRETIEDVEPGHPDFQLLEDLGEGLYDHESSGKSIEFLISEVARKKKEKQEKLRIFKDSLVEMITS